MLLKDTKGHFKNLQASTGYFYKKICPATLNLEAYKTTPTSF